MLLWSLPVAHAHGLYQSWNWVTRDLSAERSKRQKYTPQLSDRQFKDLTIDRPDLAPITYLWPRDSVPTVAGILCTVLSNGHYLAHSAVLASVSLRLEYVRVLSRLKHWAALISRSVRVNVQCIVRCNCRCVVHSKLNNHHVHEQSDSQNLVQWQSLWFCRSQTVHCCWALSVAGCRLSTNLLQFCCQPRALPSQYPHA